MTREEAIEILKVLIDYEYYGYDKYLEALEMAIKALEQQQRDCNTCKHSDNGNCAYTEECHECMWKSKYDQQPCEDCTVIKKLSKKYYVEDAYGYTDEDIVNKVNEIIDVVNELSSVTPTRPTGKWIDIGDEGLVFKCSICGTKKTIESHFCPNCGAKMTESEE